MTGTRVTKDEGTASNRASCRCVWGIYWLMRDVEKPRSPWRCHCYVGGLSLFQKANYAGHKKCEANSFPVQFLPQDPSLSTAFPVVWYKIPPTPVHKLAWSVVSCSNREANLDTQIFLCLFFSFSFRSLVSFYFLSCFAFLSYSFLLISLFPSPSLPSSFFPSCHRH